MCTAAGAPTASSAALTAASKEPTPEGTVAQPAGPPVTTSAKGVVVVPSAAADGDGGGVDARRLADALAEPLPLDAAGAEGDEDTDAEPDRDADTDAVNDGVGDTDVVVNGVGDVDGGGAVVDGDAVSATPIASDDAVADAIADADAVDEGYQPTKVVVGADVGVDTGVMGDEVAEVEGNAGLDGREVTLADTLFIELGNEEDEALGEPVAVKAGTLPGGGGVNMLVGVGAEDDVLADVGAGKVEGAALAVPAAARRPTDVTLGELVGRLDATLASRDGDDEPVDVGVGDVALAGTTPAPALAARRPTSTAESARAYTRTSAMAPAKREAPSPSCPTRSEGAPGPAAGAGTVNVTLAMPPVTTAPSEYVVVRPPASCVTAAWCHTPSHGLSAVHVTRRTRLLLASATYTSPAALTASW